jgi:hypothetical protein
MVGKCLMKGKLDVSKLSGRCWQNCRHKAIVSRRQVQVYKNIEVGVGRNLHICL